MVLKAEGGGGGRRPGVLGPGQPHDGAEPSAELRPGSVAEQFLGNSQVSSQRGLCCPSSPAGISAAHTREMLRAGHKSGWPCNGLAELEEQDVVLSCHLSAWAGGTAGLTQLPGGTNPLWEHSPVSPGSLQPGSWCQSRAVNLQSKGKGVLLCRELSPGLTGTAGGISPSLELLPILSRAVAQQQKGT